MNSPQRIGKNHIIQNYMLITDKNNSKLILKIILTLGSSKQSVIDREAERALEEKAGINYTKIQRVNKSLICIGS